jgi:putative transposase
VKYAWISQHAKEFRISLMCKCLSVTRSSYYDWLKGPLSAHQQANLALSTQIKEVFKDGHQSYGTRRIKHGLAALGLSVSRRRIGKLMKKMNLSCKTKRRFIATTDSKHSLPIAPNLLARNFTASKPDQCYVGDITYIPTQTGWLYLAVVIDLFSRKVVGWSMESHMKAGLVNNALLMAIWKRKPLAGLLWHTDRGSQYASESHRELLVTHKIKQSMSRKGNCWDNAVSESFFHTLKTELVHHVKFNNQEEAKKAIFEYIEVFYNRSRMHSANDYLSPQDYEVAAGF